MQILNFFRLFCRSIRPLFLAIRNPEAGHIIQSMRKDLSQDISTFINEHAPELDLDYKSQSSSNSTSRSLSPLNLGPSQDNITHLVLTAEEGEGEQYMINHQSGRKRDRKIKNKIVY